MSKTLAEIAIALVVLAIFFRLGLELAPLVIEWWRDTTDAADGDERNNHDENQ